jgi:hypothetical protein
MKKRLKKSICKPATRAMTGTLDHLAVQAQAQGAGTHITLSILSFFVRFFIHRHIRFCRLAS